MNRIASMPVTERSVVFAEAAERLQIQTVIVEKDFWVCWMLGRLFERPEWRETLVFKGGTALSKVFGVIRRFSEDIDLSVSPATLGISESEVDHAGSRRQRDQWMDNLEAACGKWVSQQLQPQLEEGIRAVLGQRLGGQSWLEYQLDTTTHSPVLLFYYPSVLAAGAGYIRRWVKLEFGSLTDQRPVGQHRVRPWLADILPAPLVEMGCDVVALEVERAFWEKATILHAE
ncbi:MAG: nucleotidyl transferase AbiEii/AbiGii toxin family protein, partial [Limisphaerales bacterium]